MDALSEMLRTTHLSGTAFIDAKLTAPWAVQTPTPAEIAHRLAPHAGRIIPYHLVAEGSCSVRVGHEAPIVLGAQDVAWFPHGDVHVLASDPSLEPLRISAEMVVQLTRPDSIASANFGGAGATTRLICGFFACDHTLSDQLIGPLPRVLTFHGGAGTAASMLPLSLQGSLPGLHPLPKPGAKAVLCKLSELLFVDAVRAYVDGLPEGEGRGWFAGLKDPHVGHALALVHAQPGSSWSLETLAAAVGTSRTTLADRFLRCLGEPPMQYLGRWRLQLAAYALATSDRPIKRIATDAGFSTVVAFGRAFKRELGVPPGIWRKARRQTHAAEI